MSDDASPPTVRSLALADIPAVVALAKSCSEAAQWTPSAYETHFEDICGWVLTQEERVVGFLVLRSIISAQEAEILNLAVDENSRRKGYARSLLQAALKDCASCQINAVFLEARESNSRAISFYEKHGFTPSSRRPGYYRNPDEAAVCMTRKLLPLSA